MYPFGNRFNFVAQGMQYEALRVFLRTKRLTMAIEQFEILQIGMNPDRPGHARTTDECFESDGVKKLKQENKSAKKKKTFQDMTQSFMDDTRSTISQSEFDRRSRFRIPHSENIGEYVCIRQSCGL